MRIIIESYAGIWVMLLLFIIAMAFTTININVGQARKIYNDIRAEVQASNGSVVDDTGRFYYNSATDNVKSSTSGYQFEYSIIRQGLVDDNIQAGDETYIYNNVYKISMRYEYYVPLFGKQVYPMTGYAY